MEEVGGHQEGVYLGPLTHQRRGGHKLPTEVNHKKILQEMNNTIVPIRVKTEEAELTAVHRKFGEYWKNLHTRSTASGGKRFWKTCP